MDVFESIQTVLAVRSYQDKPIPADAVERILEAGRLTGSAMNRQPWHFVVVRDREMLEKLGETVSSGPYIAQAALAIVIAIENNRFAVSDGSRAIQSMVLAAWSEGIGSNWAGFMGPDEVKPLLGIPDELEILAVLPFGYPDQVTGRGNKSRKPLEEIAHDGTFGQPFSPGG